MINKTQKFIKKARQIHGDRYDYSKVEYVNANTKVCIICPEHGEFWQTPSNHLTGYKCKKCGIEEGKNKRSLTTEEFIKRSKEIYDAKFTYEKTKYINNHTFLCITENGIDKWVLPTKHLECKPKLRNYDREEFIEESFKKFGYKYDYSKVEYNGCDEKVCIICPEHGEFWQTPRQHLKGQGCLSCSNIKCCNTEEFIAKAKRVHGDKYDYSKVNYINNKTPVCIICPEHGEFWQRPDNHLQGQGCPVCNSSKLEFEIFNFLSNHNISFKRQKKFEWLINEKTGYNLYLDFIFLIIISPLNVKVNNIMKTHGEIINWNMCKIMINKNI